MKRGSRHLLLATIAIAAIAAAAAWWTTRAERREPLEPAPAPIARAAKPALTEPPAAEKSEPDPEIAEVEAAKTKQPAVTRVEHKPSPPQPSARPPAPRAPMTEEQRRAAYARQVEGMQRAFERRKDQLAKETDANRRMSLIKTIARQVRIDTTAAIDWAMSLEEPAERYAALEAINQHALVGIGAHIETAENGYPRIRETTALSAIASTGMAEKGDYITGIINADGSTSYLRDQPIHEVAARLRGEAGTAVTLWMQRPAENGGAPMTYQVVVPRSLIVVEPKL